MPREVQTRTLTAPGASIVYDVHGPMTARDARPPLLMVGQPMDASGFAALAAYITDRTVVTYDPRGLGRSTRSDAGARWTDWPSRRPTPRTSACLWPTSHR